MKTFALGLIVEACVSCTTQFESMKRKDGSSYTYLLNKVGGQAAAESSSGTKLVVNDENSFAAFLQTVGASIAGWSYASVQKAKEISSQVAAKEITKQQAQQQMAAVQQAELAAKGATTSEAIKARAEITPVTVHAP